MRKFILFCLTLTIVSCSRSKAPYSINITDAYIVYHKELTTRGASNGGYYKIDNSGNESRLVMYTEDEEASNIPITSIKKIDSNIIVINGTYFADIRNGILYEVPFLQWVVFNYFYADNGLLYRVEDYTNICEIDLVNHAYRNILPDGQQVSYCAVDKDGLCMYVVDGRSVRPDPRFRLSTGRIIRAETIVLEGESTSEDTTINASDEMWFMHKGVIHRVKRCRDPRRINIYSYQEDNGDIVAKLVATHEDNMANIHNGALIYSNIENDCHYILFERTTPGYFLYKFDGKHIKCHDGYSSGIDASQISQLYGIRVESRGHRLKQVKIKSNPIFITNGVVYQLNTDSGYITQKCTFDLNEEYDVYNFQYQFGLNKAMFSGMRYLDGAIVAGEVTYNESDYGSSVNISILKEEKASYNFTQMTNLGSFQ